MRNLSFFKKNVIQLSGVVLALFLPLLASAEVNQFFAGSTEDYPQPLYFDADPANVEMQPLLLSYELTSEALNIGGTKMQPGDFFVDMVTLKRGSSQTSEDVLIIQWPEFLMRDGTVEFISRTGKVLWSKEITDKGLEEWSAGLGGWKTKAQFGIREANAENTPFWTLNEPFRACLTKGNEKVQTRLCSAQFRMEMQKEKPRIYKLASSPQAPRVILDNKQAPLQQEVPVKIGTPVQFYAELSDGSSYEFYAIPKKISLVDLTGNKEQTEAQIVTEGLPPIQKTEIINKEKNSRFVEFIGWQQTIGDFRQYWRTKIPFGDSQILIAGEGGGAFLQKMKINKLPMDNIRPFLAADSIEGTYIDGSSLYVRRADKTKVGSKQNKVDVEKGNREFTWEFGAQNRGVMNRSYLLVNDGKTTFRAYHELFKGFPREISIRSTVAGTLTQYTFIGEVAFNYWFESLLGWDNSLLSTQRWGIASRYFRSINELKLGTLAGTFEVLSTDLKYRLTPGMWARKETWGLIGGYQRVGYSSNRPVKTSNTPETYVNVPTDFTTELLGVGVFWARSMPKVFDDILKYVPFMDYPKWVDAEFIYYGATATPQTEISQGIVGGGNYALNFHGQVMWSDRFFGEAGFGLKQYDIIKAPVVVAAGVSSRPRFTFASLYGTVGLGYRF